MFSREHAPGFHQAPGLWVLSGKNRDEIVKLINRAIEHGPSKPPG